VQELIEEIIVAQDGIEKIFNIITIQFGPDTMLAAKVKMTPGRDLESAIADINALERTLKERIPKLAWCFVEPDIAD
jgi:divalent metal cation (Fe/Co/Zn/Cd) transporter